MDATDLAQFRELLLDKREDLLDRVRSARSSEQDDGKEGAPDLGDRAIETMSRDLLYQLSTGEREILRRIDAALKRMDADTYGVCLNCERRVQERRLQAVPWARHCIQCQELLDRGEL